MENIVGITNTRNNIKEIIDCISKSDETYIVTRDSKPEAVILSYKKYNYFKELTDKFSKLKYEKAFKKSQTQFKEWLKKIGYDESRISDKELEWLVKNLEINNVNKS